MQEYDLKKYLEKYRDSTVDFFRFMGNYGDSLIWHGTMKLLSELNIKVDYVDLTSENKHEVLFIDGGGNFVDYYTDVRDFLTAKPALYKDVVILPHTIFGDKQIKTLNNMQGDTTIFCREIVSTKFVEENVKTGKVYLWHDCAFYNSFPAMVNGSGVLEAFRSDQESFLRTKQDANNIDISYDGYATKPLDEFFAILQKYNQINTDRLHVAIAATLLGKRVKLYPNSYYKNKAVFEYSLKKFPNIEFMA
ncbi:hypothetical protein COX27_00355 [Candidatus Kuenenbacteria bacterium CG23_combo_of_CG06-09_8_20_14_all_36_9]|uniref:Polysaccharide pyruvyl transferase domain-containing protein n=1 Tax=Candidatus Kuenenbacteria bacterium CG10_big_fil_rev_8_21_14_0_10_36_11 TaxID=1974618 RepID=A0A2M6WBG5_9BACT|nr:MAG: hypothetical protein COX27_00355 [Candidatus Kuenenbacteria bacterium CG23_combo_of_CG06-09_8_20_14_all_36_9]PIT90139.1 MAG: hypothetical protein COU23_00060 [Candidatus Kuenenbacteria bacterium CG10_big_fil_rev_8_21_14_0_10_36_11]